MSFSRAPTKARLLTERRTLATTERIYKILEDKKELLMKRLNETTLDSIEKWQEASEGLAKAYDLFALALIRMGEPAFKSATSITIPDIEVNASRRKLMDVTHYTLEMADHDLPALSLNDVPIKFYEARERLSEALGKLAAAAASEDLLLRIAENLEKTRRLTTSIEKVVVPDHKETINTITFILEERDREELVRLKKIKKTISGRSAD
ncbi:MAG: V-type ATP synthase subunit D [Nitrososphaerota archaeon]|nr:V-type ATP synthase subunit D [Nitrososphaerota archaeon]MDG7048554.1 V-type ATP synthase subunit D [Nitrososphaerota archaeon]MDG7051084.1 V-type ATP synthase subunit D [Nitrososphaerota archaeon]